MRTRIVPPYPSFTYVMSQIDNSSYEGQGGDDDALAKPAPRPCSKYDDNPFMVCGSTLVSTGRLNGDA